MLSRNIDVVVALIGIVTGIGISCLNFIYSNEYLVTMGPMLAIACLGYVIFRRKLLSDSEPTQVSHTSFILVINIIFWAALAGSVYSLSTEMLHRPLIYFLLTSLSAVMIAVQILYCRGKGAIYLILFGIFILSLSIRASAFWTFPTIPGIDSLYHAAVVKDYVVQGNMSEYISNISGQNYYYSMPMMHMNVAMTQILTGVDYKAAMFLGTGLPLLLSTVFVFLIGRWLANAQVGLLAMLLLSLSDYQIMWGSENIIAMSFGISLFMIIMYVLIVHGNTSKVSMIALTILLLVTLILTHTISTFIMCCFLVMAMIGLYIYKFLYHDCNQQGRSLLTPKLVLLYIVLMLFHGMFIYKLNENMSFLAKMAVWFYTSITGDAELLVTRAPYVATEIGWLGPILNISGYLLLLLFGIIGCLLWLSWKHNSKTKIGLIAALVVMIGLPLLFPLFGITNIQPSRWPAFYYIIVSIPVAVCILTIANRIRYKGLRNVVLSCLIFSFSFLMITNSVANTDSPIYATSLTERLVYTESEITAGRIIEVYDGHIVTDGRYRSALAFSYLETKGISKNMLDEGVLNRSLIIWRDILGERPASIYTPERGNHVTVLGKSYEQKLENSHNLIYNNKDIKAFLPKDLP
ncbi:hypothetical protein ACFLWG_02480 [Chloroflexota bacterium]